ncbi:MAG: protein kinase [Thermoanaerobaculia bacterium]
MQLGLDAQLTSGDRLGPYVIVGAIGAGGMGEVYRARDERLKREVAIKVLPASFSTDPDRLRRFEKEAQAASALNHPNIMAVYDVGTQDGAPYIVSELLEGQTLRERLAGGRLPLRKAIHYAAQIARGLSAAHAKGIVHRDLKPENVFVTREDHVKILDFGVASWRPLDAAGREQAAAGRDPLTEPGVILGTLGYMSPEQVKGQAVDGRSDIFSFGTILYEMLSGRHAFKRDSAAETMSAILKEEPPELSESGRSIPPGLDQIVRHCLEKEPQNRFQSASDIAFNLSDASSPVLTSGGRAAAASGDNRRVLLGAGLLVVVVAASLFVLSHSRDRAGGAAVVKRVAVLPFENLGAAQDDYFTDGIADAIRGKMTSLPGVQVIARGSSTPYKKTTKSPTQIAHELEVPYLLTATVRWQKGAGGASRVEVSPELVEVPAVGAPTSKWQQSFDASLTDVFRVQSEIAAQVARSLGSALGVGEAKRLAEAPTSNLDAYDAFLKGEELWDTASSDPASLRKMLTFYEQAVALDPRFAQAWAKVSRSSSILYINSIPMPELAERARQAAEKAMALAPNRYEGYLALGNQRFVSRDFERSLEELTKGRHLAPGDSELLRETAYAEGALGRWGAAVEHFTQAAVLDPRSANNAAGLGGMLVALRRYGEAREALDRGLAFAPSNLDLIETKAVSLLMEGDLAGARAVLQAAAKDVEPTALVAYVAYVGDYGWVLDAPERELLLRLTPSAFDGDRGVWGLCLAQAYGWKGDFEKVRAFADEAKKTFEDHLRFASEDPQRHLSLGLALAYLGQKERAIREGERGVALDPISKDALYGPYYQHQLVRIYLLVGEQEKALDRLEPLLKIPYALSPALLRIDPNFDPLRGNPRFKKLVAQKG